MQSTDIKDCNGEEIYEGGIIEICDYDVIGREVEEYWLNSGDKFEVEFESGCFRIGGVPLFYYSGLTKVVGNVYENAD